MKHITITEESLDRRIDALNDRLAAQIDRYQRHARELGNGTAIICTTNTDYLVSCMRDITATEIELNTLDKMRG